MKLKEFDITLDIKKTNQVPCFEVVAGDFETNVLNITLTDGTPYSLDGLSAEIVFAKPDGTTVVQDESNGVIIEGDVIRCTLASNTIAISGTVFAEVRVLQDAKVLTSPIFRFYVRNPILNDKTVKSLNEYPMLVQATENAKEAARNAIDAANAASQAANSANTAAANANTAADNANAAYAEASSAAVYANQQGDYAKTQGQAANTAALSANSAASSATTAAYNANTKATYAQTQGDYAKEQGDYAKAKGDAANEAAYTANAAADLAYSVAGVAQNIVDTIDEQLDAKADKSALSETNLRVAEIGKDLSDYKAVLSQLNPNQEAKQTISGYGIVRLPVNAANGHMDVAVGGNTEINENGMQHTVSAMRIVSESEDETQRTELYIPDYGELRSVPNGTADEISGGQLIQRVKTIAITANAIRGLGTAGVNVDWVVISKPTDYIGYGTSGYATGTITFGNYTEKRISTLDLPENINCISSFGPEVFYLVIPKGTYADLNAAKTALAGTKLTYQLAEPIITPINVSGTLLSYPKGTVYAEPVLPVAGIYTAEGIAVTNTDFPIDSIEQIVKIDFATGLETPVDVSQAVIAEDRLSFTHEDLSDGDIVFFTYYYSNTGTQPKISATYFDSRYVLKDTVTGKFYKKVETVQNGQLTTQLVEVS